MKKNSASSTKKLTLNKSTIQNLGVASGIQTGLFTPNSTPCTALTKGWGCVP